TTTHRADRKVCNIEARDVEFILAPVWVAIEAIDDIGTVSGRKDKDVIAAATVHDVVAGTTGQNVIAATAVKCVITGAGINAIVAAPGGQPVVAAVAGHDVGERIAITIDVAEALEGQVFDIASQGVV